MKRTPEYLVSLGGNLIDALLDDYDHIQDALCLVKAANMAVSSIDSSEDRAPMGQLITEIERKLEAIIQHLEAGNDADIARDWSART